MNLSNVGNHRFLQLNELEKLRNQAYENSRLYKEHTKKIHDQHNKSKEFHFRDRVLLYNSRLKLFSGKLKSRWSGPFVIRQVFPYGTIELSHPNGSTFKVNGHCLKHYKNEPSEKEGEEILDLHFTHD